jgi:hypothetical protein
VDKVIRISLQIVFYAAFAAIVGYLSFWPRYEYGSAGMAEVKISLSHAAARVEPCVQLTPQEIAQLAPNMRRSQTCERKRVPLVLELEIDGVIIRRLEVAPSGLWEDGPASVYERFELAPGEHHVAARLRDTARSEGWDYTHSEKVVLEAGRYLTITFRPETGGFGIR